MPGASGRSGPKGWWAGMEEAGEHSLLIASASWEKPAGEGLRGGSRERERERLTP